MYIIHVKTKRYFQRFHYGAKKYLFTTDVKKARHFEKFDDADYWMEILKSDGFTELKILDRVKNFGRKGD